MVITKYNRGNRKYTIGSQASINATTNGGSTTTTNSSSSSDNYLWGNYNDGTADVEETIFVNGSVYAMPKLYEGLDEDDDIEEEDGEIAVYEKQLIQPFDDDEGGNIYAENLIKSFGDIKADNSVESKEVYGHSIYLDYPEVKTDNSNKTNLLDLLKSHKKLTIKDSKNNELGIFDNTEDKTITIKNYDDEISGLSSRITTNETNISNNEKRIENNETEITNLWETVNSQDTSSPVVLFSGIIHANNNDSSLVYQDWVIRPLLYSQHFGVQGLNIDYLIVSGQKKPTLVVEVIPKDGYYIKATSINASVSLNEHWNPAVDFGGNRRSQGYWTTGGVFADGKIYLQVWRTKDENNDSTTNDCIAYNVKEMNITIFGTATKTG